MILLKLLVAISSSAKKNFLGRVVSPCYHASLKEATSRIAMVLKILTGIFQSWCLLGFAVLQSFTVVRSDGWQDRLDGRSMTSLEELDRKALIRCHLFSPLLSSPLLCLLLWNITNFPILGKGVGIAIANLQRRRHKTEEGAGHYHGWERFRGHLTWS